MFLVRVPCHDRRVRSVPPTLEAPVQASIDGPSSALPRPAEDDNELAVVDVLLHALGVQAHSAAEPLADRRVEKDKCPSPPSRLGGAAPRRPTCAILPRSEGLPGGSPSSARPEYPLGNARGLRFRGGRRCGSRRQV